MLNDVLQTGSWTSIRRVRKLPFPGQVLVNEGEQVQPDDVIAETSLPGALTMLEIAHSLGVAAKDAQDCLIRQPGEDLNEDDVIAQIEGPIPRLVRTPIPAKFAAFHKGKAVLVTGTESIHLKAGMIGIVESVIPEYGAILTANGILIQGIWGNGRIGFGELAVLEESWLTSLNRLMLAEVERGQVIAAGHCSDGDVLVQLEKQGLAGLMINRLAPGLITTAVALSLPVIVLGGFGDPGQDSSALELLKPHTKALVSVNGNDSGRLTGYRPEVIIPQPEGVEADALASRAVLRIGHRVRLCSGSAQGQEGEVLALPEQVTEFGSGLPFPSAIVQVENGGQVTIPQQNLVILR